MLHFLQARVLAVVVLGLTESAAVGVLVFKLQARLPCRKVLLGTGVSFPSWMGSGWACS